MKKILVVAIALIASLVSMGQDNGTSQEWNNFYSKAKKENPQTQIQPTVIQVSEYSTDNSKFIPTSIAISFEDKYIKFNSGGSVKVLEIQSKHIITNNQTFYKCKDTSNMNELVEVSFYYDSKLIVLNRGMVSLTGVKVIETSYLNFGQSKYKSTQVFRSVGGVGGYGITMDESNLGSASWGVWIDLGYVGIEFHQGVNANYNSDDAMNYINGSSPKFVAGGMSTNLGLFTKLSPHETSSMYFGAGLQVFNEISTGPSEKKNIPYISLGFISKLSDAWAFKVGVIGSKQSMLNLGFGFTLK